MIRCGCRPSRACPGWPAVTKTGEISNVTSGENCSATHKAGNSRDGYGKKTVVTDTARIELDVPRDRQSSFDPHLIAKYQRRFPGFDEKIISMYARGMSVREIVGHLGDLYGVDVSPDLISAVTDAVLDEVAAWQGRPLEPVYPLVFFDALRVKIRDEGLVRNKAVYVALGACLLNPGEMGFEPLKPVGELDAANSRIRFDVRVEALRPSFVAPFPRWRSSAHCECGKGRSPPLGELQDIVGEADEAPLLGDLLDAAQEKLTEAARLLDLSEHRLGQLLS